MQYVNYVGKLLAESSGVVRTNGSLPCSDVLAEHGIYNMRGGEAVRKIYNFPPEKKLDIIQPFDTRLYYADFDGLIVYVLKHTYFDTTQKRCAIEARVNL